jgi:DNA-binding HxlR family transcriptional regulator
MAIPANSENPLACPVVATLNLMGGKWKPMLIHALHGQPMRFGQLKKLMVPISQKVLTEQLRELENNHIVLREVLDAKIVQVTYSLTDYGQSLAPVLDALYVWGEQHAAYAGREVI